MKVPNALKEYCVPFTGLKDGFHHFDFKLNKSFFEAFEHSEISDAGIVINVTLNKTPTMLDFESELSGTVALPCDRCGELIDQQVQGHYRLIVKFGDETGEIDDDILVFGPAEHQVNLAHYFYEYAHLSLPVRRVHERIEECDPDTIKRLNQLKVESDSESEWIALKNMELEELSQDWEEEE